MSAQMLSSAVSGSANTAADPEVAGDTMQQLEARTAAAHSAAPAAETITQPHGQCYPPSSSTG